MPSFSPKFEEQLFYESGPMIIESPGTMLPSIQAGGFGSFVLETAAPAVATAIAQEAKDTAPVSPSPLELLPPITETQDERLRDLNSQVVRDYFLSFRYSQGSPQLQHDQFDWIVDYYRRTWAEADWELLPHILSNLTEKAANMRIPKEHKPQLDSSRAEEFARQNQEFALRLKRTKRGVATVVDGVLLSSILEKTIGRDLKYAEDGRPNSVKSDPYRSHFRQHGLVGEPTGSEAYDQIFMAIRDLLQSEMANGFTRGAFTKLVKIWESKPDHEGKFFIPRQPSLMNRLFARMVSMTV